MAPFVIVPGNDNKRESCGSNPRNVLLDSLRERISATENQALTLRLGGVPWREVGEILGQRAGKTEKMRRSITENARVIWSVSVPDRAGTVRVENGDGVGKR